jgi:hypothetical protein
VPAECDLGGPVTDPKQIDRTSLAQVFEHANEIDTLLIGTEAKSIARAAAQCAPPDACDTRYHADRACDPHLQCHDGRASPVAAALIAVP